MLLNTLLLDHTSRCFLLGPIGPFLLCQQITDSVGRKRFVVVGGILPASSCAEGEADHETPYSMPLPNTGSAISTNVPVRYRLSVAPAATSSPPLARKRGPSADYEHFERAGAVDALDAVELDVRGGRRAGDKGYGPSFADDGVA